jgi:hypothetical protein
MLMFTGGQNEFNGARSTPVDIRAQQPRGDTADKACRLDISDYHRTRGNDRPRTNGNPF